MKATTLFANVALVISLAQLSACQDANFSVSLCEGKPAYDLSPLAGTYTRAVRKDYKDGLLIDSENRVFLEEEDGGNAVFSVKNGNQLQVLESVSRETKDLLFMNFRACRIGNQVWAEDVATLGRANYGFQLLSHDANSFTVKAEAISEALLKQEGIPFKTESVLFGGNRLIIDNRNVAAEKVLQALSNDTYSIYSYSK